MIIFKHKNVLVLAKLEQLHGCSFCPNSPSWSSRWQQFRKSLNKRFHTTTRRPPDTSTLCQIMFTRSSKSFIHKPKLPWTGVWISVMHLLEQSRPALGTVSAKNVIKNKKRTESGIDIWSQPGQIVGARIVSIWQQQRQSLTNLNHPAKLVEDPVLIGNRVSAARHSARLPNAQERQNFVDPRGEL